MYNFYLLCSFQKSLNVASREGSKWGEKETNPSAIYLSFAKGLHGTLTLPRAMFTSLEGTYTAQAVDWKTPPIQHRPSPPRKEIARAP